MFDPFHIHLARVPGFRHAWIIVAIFSENSPRVFPKSSSALSHRVPWTINDQSVWRCGRASFRTPSNIAIDPTHYAGLIFTLLIYNCCFRSSFKALIDIKSRACTRYSSADWISPHHRFISVYTADQKLELHSQNVACAYKSWAPSNPAVPPCHRIGFVGSEVVGSTRHPVPMLGLVQLSVNTR